MRARSALFTLFGDVVRPAGGDAWLTTLTGCMATLGFSAQATRTALHRMAVEGWVSPSRAGRFSAYRLTDRGVERLDEAAARIYRLRAADWDGTWRLLVSPQAGRISAVARELQWSGHGRLTPDVWVSPHATGRTLDRLLATHDLSKTAVRFSTASAGASDDQRIVTTAWDLSELRAAHAEFIDAWLGVTAPAQPHDAFAMRIRLVHHWRSFLFLDPGLPAQLLPSDWLGDTAAAVFRRLYDDLDDPAWRFYDELAAQAPAGTGATPARVRTNRRTAESAFTADLDSLQISTRSTS